MPTTLHVAFTAPVNPSGSSPTITRAQLWAGLERKVRHAQDFVPVFTDTKVLKEEGNVITRRAFIKDGAMPHVKERYLEEVCTLYAPTKVDFLSSGNLAQNVICKCDAGLVQRTRLTSIVADGSNMTEEDLQLTYIFDWTYSDVEAGSEEERTKVQEQKKGAKNAIDMTLKSVRGMIERGEL